MDVRGDERKEFRNLADQGVVTLSALTLMKLGSRLRAECRH